MRIPKTKLIREPKNGNPHIVILGAGASVAAFPNGDANGKKLPTMDNFIETLDMKSLLLEAGISDIPQNFEAIYSELYERDPDSPILSEIERTVYAYFDDLVLPENPTLYDHLLMSLRPKDIIATFNWDPFLFDAWMRNKEKIPLPEIIHLHGNVRVFHCPDHADCYGERGMSCSTPCCENELIPSRLLFPITRKNYTNDPFIKSEWNVFGRGLRKAKTLTIFGYGAPTTDRDAIEIMKSEWDKDKRFIDRVEVIDIKSRDILWNQWDPFIIRTYFNNFKTFYESRIAGYPRRTCEALEYQTRGGMPVYDNPLPIDADFEQLYSWFEPFVEAEQKLKESATSA